MNITNKYFLLLINILLTEICCSQIYRAAFDAIDLSLDAQNLSLYSNVHNVLHNNEAPIMSHGNTHYKLTVYCSE